MSVEWYRPDSTDQNVHEEVVGGRGNVSFGQEDLVVATLHEILL